MGIMGACKKCGVDIDPNNVFGETYICSHCNHSAQLPSIKDYRKLKRMFGALAAIATILFSYNFYQNYHNELTVKYKRLKKISSSEYQISKMSLAEVMNLKRQCLFNPVDAVCLVHVYKRLLKSDPTNVNFQTQYTIRLTETAQYSAALPVFKKLISQGRGTYELMTSYGDALAATGQTELALKWYKNALSIEPGLATVAEKIATQYLQLGHKSKAKKVIKDFIRKYPQSRDYLKGNLISIDASSN